MKNYLVALSTLLLLGLTACKDTGKAPSNVTIDGATTEQTATPTDGQATPGQSTPATANEGAVASNINPAHGQPGHRCDIPVGAPLDTPPGGGNAMQAAPQPATSGQGQPFLVNDDAKNRIIQEQGKPATANSGKINPPHGQPGHSCETPVGQPLP
ncbi:hypothetical protein [Myroides fluvii]|uniref:hypothetical protein n=1 Tax=Myroides fluvii TaxID=2572594 RepID=UPI00131B5466|nr:hypothetical protein [Myroides fluvii]